MHHEWWHSIYGDIMKSYHVGKLIQTSLFFNANLYHDLFTGCAMTGILHQVNQTPIEWYCKKQATLATAMYSSEFVAM